MKYKFRNNTINVLIFHRFFLIPPMFFPRGAWNNILKLSANIFKKEQENGRKSIYRITEQATRI